MVNIAKPIDNEEEDSFLEDFIVDPETGIKRVKSKKIKRLSGTGIPSAPRHNSHDLVKVSLHPDNWFLTQSSILACLPIKDGKIPLDLLEYVNANFNTYPVSEIKNYAWEFRNSLLFHNHSPERAYGFVIDVKERPVQIGKHELIYVEILTAVNRNIDRKFADKIQSRDIKYMSWAHSAGDMVCAVCGDSNQECKHFDDMINMTTPIPAVNSGKPYGILHMYSPTFNVYEASYLDVRPAFDGAISNEINTLDKPLEVMVSRSAFMEKAKHASRYEDDLKPSSIVEPLFRELGI